MTVFASDNLAVASGTTIQAEDANWTKNAAGNNGNVIGNTDATRSRQSSSTTGYYYYNVAPPSADYKVSMRLMARATVGSNARVGVIGRFSTSALSGYRFLGSSIDSTWTLSRIDAGTNTTLDTASQTFANSTDYDIELRMVGTAIEGWVDGVKVCEAVDSVYSAAGYAGLATLHTTAPANSTGIHMSLWSADSIDPPDEVAFAGTVPTLNGVDDEAFDVDLSGYFSGTITPLVYSLQSGTLPAGLSINASTGHIAGTPTTPGTSSGIVIRCTDDDANTADTNSFSIIIAADNAAPTFPGPDIANDATMVEGVALTPQDVTSKFSDPGDTLTYSPQGSWPPGVTVSSAGVISGTPTTAGEYGSLKVRATDLAAQTVDSNTFTYTVDLARDPGSFGTLVSPPLTNNTGTLRANLACKVWVYDVDTGALVHTESGLETDENGVWTFTDAALDVSTAYRCVTRFDVSGAEAMDTYTTGA